MRFFQFSLIFISVFFLQACKNELKLNAPYEEIPSIYAVMSPHPEDSVQIIRVNKNFLGEKDANIMAKAADSINYPAGELSISMRRFVNGQRVSPSADHPSDTVLNFRDSLITNVEGGSFSTTQRIYVCYSRLHNSGEYRLVVKNNRTGNVFTAKANSLPPVTPFFKPFAGPPFYPFPGGTDQREYVDYSNSSRVYEIRHLPNESIIYQLVLRMHYYDSVSFQEKYNRSVEIPISTRNIREIQKIGNLSFLSHTFSGGVIFTSVANELSKHRFNLIGRKMFAIEYIVYNSSQEYMDYMQYVRPSLSISQSKPLYSNFDEQKALGIFTFRNRVNTMKNIHSFYINAFALNPSTCNFKFFTSQFAQPGCK